LAVNSHGWWQKAPDRAPVQQNYNCGNVQTGQRRVNGQSHQRMGNGDIVKGGFKFKPLE